jgi:PAS domain S-box-containing protein
MRWLSRVMEGLTPNPFRGRRAGERRGQGSISPPPGIGLDAQALLDSLPAYVTVQDRAFRIVQANEAFVKDFGDCLGRPCFQAYKGKQEVCAECHLTGSLAQGRSCSWEERLRTVHGETVLTVVHSTPLRNARGEIHGALKISSDVSELKRLQRQLELSQQEYKALFQGVPCYISVQDRDFKILKTNRYFDHDFGRSLGRRCYRVYKNREETCPDCPVEKTFQDGRIHSSEETVWLRNGKEAQMIVYTAPLYDVSNKIFAVMEMSANITEVKRLQRELATLGEAVAVTAHTIKNILNGLKGGAYVVQSGLQRNDPDLAKQGWEMVQEGVDLVGGLVKDILLISKERVPDYEQVNPNEPAKKVWTLYEKRAKDLGIQLVLEPDERAQEIRLDPKGVHTVIANLVANALDALSGQQGRHERRITLKVADLGAEGVAYEVADTGPGIPESIRDKLFRDVVSTKGSSGTGLGLVVTRKIVEEHGGRVDWQPNAPRGTVCSVRLPRRAGADEAARRSAEGTITAARA